MAVRDHSTAAGLDLHEAKRTKAPVRAASTANITLTAPGAAIDGVTLVSGDRILLKDQSTASQNGIYVWNGAAVAATRATDAAVAADFVKLFKIGVSEGTANGATYWTFTQTAAITVGTTALTFTKDGGTSFANQSANTVYAGPTSGGAAAPAFRAVVPSDVPVMVASGGSHAAGLVPDPGSTAGTTKFLREDATFAVPAGGGSGSSGGTGGSIVPIQTQTPTSGTSITFDVPAGFKNLRISGVARSGVVANTDSIALRFNGDTGANYNRQLEYATGASPSAVQSTGQTSLIIGNVPGANALANTPGEVNVLIPNHAGTTWFKGILSHAADVETGAASGLLVAIAGGYWANAGAITSVTILLGTGPFVTGSTFTLWGEADTAPVLLTSNSNLIQETILTAATATISVPNIPQGYRDLRVVIQGRGDTAATFTAVSAQFNADTGSNYDWTEVYNSSSTAAASSEGLAQTSTKLGNLAAATAPANNAGAVVVEIPNYSAATFFKNTLAQNINQRATASGNTFDETFVGQWRSTAAITSILLILAAGNFAAGSVVRVYGEPAAAAGPSVGTGTRLRMSGNQSITTATATTLTWDTEDQDADNQHYTSTANLTGTVAKTAASATLTGTGTAFTTELSIGQVISVPGTATEKRVVTAIASATSLTVNSAFVNTASGQTAARVNSAIVFRQPGFYSLEANVYSAALASGAVTLAYYLNSLTTATSGTAIGQRDPVFVNASAGYDLVIQRQFQQWDFVEVVWTQNSGGSVNVLADERTHWSISARPTVIVAVPFACIEDQKGTNTSAGTFTAGAWQPRTLNTVVSDTASIVTLGSSQVTLGPGTYRVKGSAPAYRVDAHQTRLQNVTDATTLLTGTSEYSGGSGNTQSRSLIEGRFQLTGTKALELQHQCQTTGSGNGGGIASNFGTEVYSRLIIERVG